jgi:hypothetical protein
MATVRELVTRIGFNVDQRKLDNVNRSVKHLKTRLDDVSGSLLSTGTRLTAFATTAISYMGYGIVKAASDAAESASKLSVVFEGLETQTDKVIKNLVDNYGLARAAAVDLVGNTGLVLKGFGLQGDAALELSEDINTLAVDVASFRNVEGGAERVSRAVTKALLGEREMLKDMGIAIREADVQARMLADAQKGLTYESEEQAKVYATLALIMEKTKDDQGDFARTSHFFANQMRILSNRLLEAKISLGELILPEATKFVEYLISLIEDFNSLGDGTKLLILRIAGFIALAGPLLLILGGMIKAVSVLISVFTGLRTAFLFIKGIQFAATLTTIVTALKGVTIASLAAQASFLLIPAAILAVGAALTWVILKIDEMFPFLDSLVEAINYVFEAFMLGIPETIKEIGRLIQWIGELFGLLDEEKEVKVNAENPEMTPQERYKPISQRIAEGDTSAVDNFLATRTYGPEMTPEMRAMQTQSTNNVNVKSDIVVNVPAGTSEQQAAFLKQAAREAFREEYERSLQNAVVNNPELE